MISPSSSTINLNNQDKLKLLNACRQGDLDYLGKFIVDGGNLRNVIDNQTGQTTLHYCVKFGEEKIIDEKDDKKPNGNDIQIFQRQLDRLKCTRVIIKSNPEFLTYYDYNGFTPIHLAVIHGDIDFLKVLNEFNNVDMKIKTKAKSLMSSSSSTSHSDSSEINNTGRTIIHLCVIYSQLDVLNYLLTSSNHHNYMKEIVNEYDDQGATALHYSVQVNAEQIDELFELLINIGGANLNAPDTHGRTPIIWAATVGSTHAVEVLLKLGANLNHKDSHGLAALHCAASRGNLQTVQTILNWITIANKDDESKVALLRDVNDNDGCSPLFYSVATGHIHVTECLIKAGADVMHTDFKGRTVCHCLARLNSLSNGIKFDSLIKTQLTCLVEAGLNPWLPNKTGLTALHEACLLRNVSFIKQLATLPGFNTVVNATESQGHTPLHLVVAASWSTEPSGIRLCHYLLEHGADVNAVTRLPNDEHVTPLNLAYLNETNDETSKNLLINLIKQYGGRTYQELSNERKVSIDKVHSSCDNGNTKIDINTDGNHNDVNQDNLSASGVFNPENELKLIEKTENSSSIEAVETIVGEKPQMIDSSTEPIREFIVSSTLKDSSVQTCLDRRRRKKLSTQSLTLLSSEEPMHENISTVHSHNLTDKCLNESLSVASAENSSSITLKNGTERNNSSNYDSGQNINASIQLIVRVPTPSDLKLRNDKSSESKTVATEKKNVPITLISTDKNHNNIQKDNCPHFTSSGVDDKTPRNSKHLPYSQIYLEKELPLILKRYLEKENFNYSPLTGRSRMPRPTISPYLQPVVPGLSLYEENVSMFRKNSHNKRISRKQAQSAGVYNNNRSHSNNQQNKSISKTNTKIINRKRFCSSASASNCSTMDVSIPGSYHTNKIMHKNIKYPQARSQSSRNLHVPSNDNHEVQQSVADYEFYRFLNQLLKQTCSITQRKKKRATTTRTTSSKIKQSLDAYDDRHSAMGGELTPINNQRRGPDLDNETPAFNSKKSTGKQLNI
ncbi:putative ank repeat-containing [Schistosoma mansoni]|uniref:Putative ank repeat-containing n=1 Tax=Schistosoma mansoni TaxID=6183 RepID=G4VPZ0_SCHMA|nr:putative ank repeat-containing [Schistosoma mansoni]|eukprot:XP_018653974.1 putative ank repeat-containing [Schistosoma mansoni]